MITQPKVHPNDPNRAGQQASVKVLFGEHNRYAVYAIHTRFDRVQWFVDDAETYIDCKPEIVRQDFDFQKAIAGLES